MSFSHKANKHTTRLFILIFTYENVKQPISFHYFILLFITLFVRLGTIPAPFYHLRDYLAYSRNTDFMGFSSWKKDFITFQYLPFL
jgi:hypothetical protein